MTEQTAQNAAEESDQIDGRDGDLPSDTAEPGDAEIDPAQIQGEIDRLYKRLPKIIGLIREESGPEVGATLQSLLATFKRINKLEKLILAPGETFRPMTLSRIYEMAVSGGGDESAVEELQVANTAFAEENKVLSDLVESMTFQINTMKRQSADEMLGMGKARLVPMDGLKSAMDAVSATMERIDAQLAILGGAEGTAAAEGKALDERLTEKLSSFDDITAELLKATPSGTTFVGRALRRFGFAYDYKDVATIRQLVVTVMRANRKMAEINATLEPVKIQMEKLRHVVNIVELYAGHEERTGPQYKEAMAEIDRLTKTVADYAQKSGSLEELDKKLADQNGTLGMVNETLGRQKEELHQLTVKRAEILNEIREKTAELEALRAPQADPATENDKLKRSLDAANSALEQQKLDTQRQQEEYIQAIAALRNRLHVTENGMLLVKLEYEIESLRGMCVTKDKMIEDETQKRLAFEERVQTWVENEEDLKRDVKFWQKHAGLKGAFAVAAGCIGMCAGLATASVVITQGVLPLGPYYMYPASAAGAVGAVFGYNGGAGFWNSILRACGGLFLGAAAGAAISSVALIPFNDEKEAVRAQAEQKSSAAAAELVKGKAALEEEKRKFLKECANVPCMLVVLPNGATKAVPLSEQYKGAAVTFDFTNKDKPTMSHQVPLTPPAPASAPK